jgi:hypothetical protein
VELLLTCVAEPHHFYVNPAPGKIFYAAPTLLYIVSENFIKPKKFKQTNFESISLI